ncbi:MAG: UDP-N-acetylmuramate dehydrogenase, partial [Candidatus Eisenbacteria bacterium]
GWAGLEWAEGIPGTVGGAIVGNAGAYGGEMARIVAEVEVFDPTKREVQTYANDECAFAYRTSRFKTDGTATAFVLGATLNLHAESPEAILGRMDAIRVRRKTNSPTGLSCGSVFKNPPGDFAGRIVESLGLKGTAVGGAEISCVHGNYIVNRDRASARDVCALIDLVRSRAREELGIDLELEVRLVGFGDEA